MGKEEERRAAAKQHRQDDVLYEATGKMEPKQMTVIRINYSYYFKFLYIELISICKAKLIYIANEFPPNLTKLVTHGSNLRTSCRKARNQLQVRKFWINGGSSEEPEL
mmetsp:Transcript_7151/g.17438  ORF Transcript_7151/g.17438 Transcript_7151/m.17438 type:complete len:108 (-) Transcript_7151:126-449(-)